MRSLLNSLIIEYEELKRNMMRVWNIKVGCRKGGGRVCSLVYGEVG